MACDRRLSHGFGFADQVEGLWAEAQPRRLGPQVESSLGLPLAL